VTKRVGTPSGPKDEYWEIYIREKGHNPVPLSETGSGIKTVLLVLLNLVVYPKLILNKPLSDFMFAFEELENNLHPAVQRRLFLYLRRLAENEGCHFFLTTHSNVVIDLFGTDRLAQILHVTHDRTCARVQTISTYLHKRNVLQDLEIRASDLLQSNVVVWVEGP
jgi:AAA15 family ATPase/GTPase